MKYNAWTLAVIGAGAVSLPAVARAEESTNAVLTALSATTISGYVDTSAHWNPGTGNANLPVYTPNGASGGSRADGFNLDPGPFRENRKGPFASVCRARQRAGLEDDLPPPRTSR